MRRALLNSHWAVITLAYPHHICRLAGFTQRITTLTSVLDDLRSGHYVRTMVTSSDSSGSSNSVPVATLPGGIEDAVLTIEGGDAVRLVVPGREAPASAAAAAASVAPPHSSGAPERRSLMAADARLVDEASGDVISFAHVPLRTPNGDVLLRSLDLEVRRGMNTLIAGPNGCGKSCEYARPPPLPWLRARLAAPCLSPGAAFFRVLRGLWPQFGGTIVRPPLSELLYIPQRPCVAGRSAGVCGDAASSAPTARAPQLPHPWQPARPDHVPPQRL